MRRGAPDKNSAQKIFLAVAFATVLIGASFAPPSYANSGNQYFGTLTGAVVGGIIGNQFGHGNGRVATTAAGVVAGAWAGNEIGYSIDNSEQRPGPSGGYAPSGGNGGGSYAGSYASPSGYKPNYVAPDDAPTPVSAYDQSYGGYCRTYSQQVQDGNSIRETYGTACLQADGTWRAVQ